MFISLARALSYYQNSTTYVQEYSTNIRLAIGDDFTLINWTLIGTGQSGFNYLPLEVSSCDYNMSLSTQGEEHIKESATSS